MGGLIATVAVFALILALSGPGDDGAIAGSGPVEFEHVHGLGVDPGNGDLYAGSHYGLIRIPEQGEPTRVGGLVQDFMGFTVVGTDRFLASGHPGQDQDGPANLGLIESTDGGLSWHTVSLAGEADFHSLEAKHGMIYGSSGGRVMVSQDGRAWLTGASLSLADLAVSPDDPNTVLATTEQGLARSTDGGRTFQLFGDAPLLQLVTWPDDGRLVGITPDGAVHASTDGGTTWEQRGSAGGAPEAFTTDGEAVHVAVGGGIVTSTDGGRSFRTRYAGS
ncbi:MAG: F510_1955 family glycosylhydrolase [Pseudonocardiaceae bacterium]